MIHLTNRTIVAIRQHNGTEITDHTDMVALAVYAMQRAIWEETTDENSLVMIGELQLKLNEVARQWKEEHR